MRTTVIVGATAVGLALVGCADPNVAPGVQDTTSFSQPAEKGLWLRTDGQSGKNNPVIGQQFAADKAACATVIDIDRACMAQHGYLLVPENQVEAKAEELRAAARSR